MTSTEHRVDHGGVEIVYDDHGPADGPPVILLHGFPDSARLWRHQVASLTAAGHRVLTPDLRGFGRSGRPEAVDAYNLLVIATDVVAVLDDAGVATACVVGHDWGAALAWAVATMAPDRVDRVVALSVGHPSSFSRADLAQREKSWYMLLFQFEDVAERWLSDDGWARFREWSNHPDADAVTAELEATGGLTSALAWYRANMPAESLVGPPIDLPPVPVPAMGIWSTGDMALLEEQMTGSAAFCAAGFRYERIEGAGHWIPLDAPDAVSALLLDFFAAP
ncbi:alpha/beta fold hydrolase [Iamia sp. SCSIO 61187]|uniref:alpha/beta fold hydrolase n=1 Tax=Iamia sp. SCSIO 61187 TaxID=2722752 RepID=UPI001C6379E2|nr:alpha/beta fold hydrolase [Iamia sp. SCSIO 61187]QYG91980.1 alpha/beta fold hydrolase [Iamia sp. SCSIO 61187]